MKTLYLHIENAFRIKEFVLRMLEEFCKMLLVMQLDCHKLVKRSVVISILFKPFEKRQIFFPAVSDSLCDEIRKLRVCVEKPAALCNSVCLIIKFRRI